MTYPKLYLKLPGLKPIRVSVTARCVGPAISLQVSALGRNIRFELIGLANQLAEMINHDPDVTAKLPGHAVLAMTPLDVVSYFEQSPVLAYLVDDVRTAVLQGAEATTSDLQLKNDLQAIQGHTIKSGADIAQVLFGDRTKTGGSFRRRILAVQQALKITTTTTQSGQKTTIVEKRAA